MLMAQLRGKLPTEVWLGSEDLLTSAVFGSLKNLPPSIVGDLLGAARPIVGSSPPAPCPPFCWLFWPYWETCEPDVVIEDERNLYVIEAKLYSEFSEDAGTGTQLRREWVEGKKRSREAGKEFWLIAVTNHASLPQAEIRQQLARASADLSRTCWLGWSDVGRIIRTRQTEEYSGWCEDLLELLTRIGVAPFDGFGQVVAVASSVPAGPLWTEETVFGVDAEGPVGFGTVLEIAASSQSSFIRPWRFLALGGIQQVSFAKSLEHARTYVGKGGIAWRPRLR